MVSEIQSENLPSPCVRGRQLSCPVEMDGLLGPLQKGPRQRNFFGSREKARVSVYGLNFTRLFFCSPSALALSVGPLIWLSSREAVPAG